jgi:hypothetical protein
MKNKIYLRMKKSICNLRTKFVIEIVTLTSDPLSDKISFERDYSSVDYLLVGLPCGLASGFFAPPLPLEPPPVIKETTKNEHSENHE